MIFYGTTYRIGDDITTTQIIAPDYCTADDPAILAAECLAIIDPSIAEQVREGDILIAGQNVGIGGNPDLAVLALQAVGFGAIICASAAPDFEEAAHAYGLPILVCPAAVVAIVAGGIVRLDLARGMIEDRITGTSYQARPLPSTLLEIIRRAQLLTRMRRVVEEEGFDG